MITLFLTIMAVIVVIAQDEDRYPDPVYKDEDLNGLFRGAELVPEIIPNAPSNLLKVEFKETNANYGNHLHFWDTLLRPEVAFNDTDESKEANSLYTLMFFSVDVGDPFYLYWMVNNIVGDGVVKRGHTTLKYVYPDPEPYENYKKPYRMVLLVYRQTGTERIKFDPKNFLGVHADRTNFELIDFLTEFNFTEYPTAGNFYTTTSRQAGYRPAYESDWMKPFFDKFADEDYDRPTPPVTPPTGDY